MDQRLDDVLHGREGNVLLPFLWMHDGHRGELPTLVKQVYDSGARALCVESRPHEHFCEQEWWDDMDVVLAEAERLGMKVWILDDKHFPTGYAYVMISKKYPERRKWQLIEEHVDVVGPARESAVLLSIGGTMDDECSAGCSAADSVSDPEDVLLGVFAYRRSEHDETLDETPIDLTANVRGRYVFWDVPEGVYRVFALYKSRRGTSQKDYIHLIDAQSVQVLLEAVYEPHYAHYARYFGNTIAGFFSDEPSLGNCRVSGGGAAPSMYDQKLGQPGLALPWSDELLARMESELGGDVRGRLAGLWYRQGDGMPEVRTAYMNAVTSLWREHFSNQIGEWCRGHGVEYIGHIIEDMDAHMRLSCSAGHYFRALDGQDMAGIDVVLHQILPGMAHYVHAASCAGGMTDPTFFDYVLARLAASLSHIQPRMADRAMCEVFGAYGWAEGVPMMKHLMDHMLVRGINRFVPHAFSPKYPDPDCPPHFNAGGVNPEFDAFAKLMRCTNRAAHLIAGTEIVSAAVLYPAEAEWSGRDCMLLGEPCQALCDAQLNYDILPIDALMEKARVEDGALRVEKMRYPALLIPRAQWLPEAFLGRLRALKDAGLKAAFVDGRPENCDFGEVVALADAAEFVRRAGGTDVRLEDPFPLLRVRHARRDDADAFMLVNESMSEAFDGTVLLPVSGPGVRAELYADAFYVVDAEEGRLPLRLGPGESTILIFGSGAPEALSARPEIRSCEPMNAGWTLALIPAGGESQPARALEKLYNVCGMDGDPDFSGTMRYETTFAVRSGAKGIDLGLVGECVRAELNGRDLGWRIDAPYVYFNDALREGENHLVLEVVNNLVHRNPDPFSHFVQLTPSGLLGPVRILY